jgi:56kDa selenium binding protein (SBP56)
MPRPRRRKSSSTSPRSPAPADKPDAIAVVDVDPQSAGYSSVVGFTELPSLGDELHHYLEALHQLGLGRDA